MKKILFIALAIAAVVLSGCRKQTPEAQLSGLQLKITTEQGDYFDKIVKSSTEIDINSFVVTDSKCQYVCVARLDIINLRPELGKLALKGFTAVVAHSAIGSIEV